MKVKFHYIILFIFCSLQLPLFAQNADSVTSESKPLHVGIVFSAAADLIQYCNNNYFNYTLELTGASNPASIKRYSVYPPSWSNTFSGLYAILPKQYTYQNFTIDPKLGVGIFLHSDKFNWINNVFELNYSRNSGRYSYNVNYTEEEDVFDAVGIYDTVADSYSQNSLLIDYRFQPTYKQLFLSFGVGCSVSLLKVNQQKNEWQDFSSYNEFANKTTYTNIQYLSNTNKYGAYVHFPLTAGIGGIIKYKKIVLVPAFYFSSYYFLSGWFKNEFYAYSFCLSIELLNHNE